MSESAILVVGADGQLGTALRQKYPNARYANHQQLDITDWEAVKNFDWSGVEVLINAAAYTNVDGAETDEGRVLAWAINATAVAHLVAVAREHNLTLVHFSTDYVFDGTKKEYTEDEGPSPLSAYGASKAAGDYLVNMLDKYYLIRTSWVIGNGKNFVRTMLELGKKGTSPTVVADQVGRLTFTSELARAIDHLLTNHASTGIYNVTNGGGPASWADITRQIFKVAGFNLTVTDTTTAEYFKGKENVANRPLNSTLKLDKIQALGFTPRDWHEDLQVYVTKEMAKEKQA